MKDQEVTLSCARADDLVAYLYHEASEREAVDFESHIERCASCAAELKAFGHVRTSVAAWRRQTLGSLEAATQATKIAPAFEPSKAFESRPSALAALRQFFALSPAWLRAATVAASLVVCALVVFAATRLLEGPRVTVVERVVEKGPSQAEVDRLVAKRVREELAARDNPGREATAQKDALPVKEQSASIVQAGLNRSSLRRVGQSRRNTSAQVSRQEYEEIARDLQLVPTRDEEELPRLIDLIDEAN